jgi:hypothetical protein
MTNDDTPNATSNDPFAVLISKDLFFVSRITGTASALGWKVITDSPAASAVHAQQPNCRGFFIDLTTPGLDLRSLVAEIGDKMSIAFGPHVQVQRLEDARAAGCNAVLPRSRFDATLNEILKSLFASS